jgi:Ca2+-transporting ATPase
MLLVGLALAFFTLYAFNASLEAGETKARTMAFATLVMAQLAAALSFSSEGSFVHGIIGNKFLVFSVAVSVVLQVAIVQWSLLEPVFRTVALSLADWAEVAGLTLGVFIAVEARKLL